MEEKVKKPYAKPAVIAEKELEVLAAECGTGTLNIFLGAYNCKAEMDCAITYS